MKVAVFSAKRYDREFLAAANAEAEQLLATWPAVPIHCSPRRVPSAGPLRALAPSRRCRAATSPRHRPPRRAVCRLP